MGDFPSKPAKRRIQYFIRVNMCAHLEDCHSDRIDIRILRRKPFLELASKSEHFGIQQLRGHPPGCALQFTTSSCVTTSQLIDNHDKSEVRQTSATPRIYQDVGLAPEISVVASCTVD